MKGFNLGFLRQADGPRRKRLLQGLFLIVTAVACCMSVYLGEPLVRSGYATTSDAGMFATALTLSLLGLGYLARRLVLKLVGVVLNLVVRLFAFPVMYIKEQAALVYIGTTGAGVTWALYELSVQSNTAVDNSYLYLLLGAGGLFVLGVLYQLVRHRLAELLAVAAVLPLLGAGIYLLTDPSPQVDSYNQVMEMKTTAEGKKDLTGQIKRLDASLNAYEQNRQHSKLWQLVFGEAPVDAAALAHFHKAVVLVQMPNKGKEAFDEVAKSLVKNPGNMYSGLSLDEVALWKNDSDQARRLLEKLIRSGQDGGRGRPNQPGRPGEQPQQPGDRRDPSREPAPGSGRQPNNIL